MPVSDAKSMYEAQKANFASWEILKDVIDQQIDLMLNYRQSGHPGGSRSKVHYFVSLLLSGAMRWDIRNPEKAFGDRFVLVAGHTAPLVYANTGPSGHGAPVCSGEAIALKRAGATGVKVFGLEGEGGHTAGCWHETKNSSYGLGLDNLNMIMDWNDFGIDPHPTSSIVAGGPRDWFEPYGWDVYEADNGSDWDQVTKAILEMTHGEGTALRPKMMFGKTRKGRDYHKYDAPSHGAPHALNSDLFWQCRADFTAKYGVTWYGTDEAAPDDGDERRQQFADNLNVALDVLRGNDELVAYLADRLVEIGESVPTEIPGFKLPDAKNPLNDNKLFDISAYPEEMWAKPGSKQPNRAGFAKWGSYINSYCQEKYGRPLFMVCSADLAGSTNIAGFGADFGDMKNTGWYNREENTDGVILPQGITEFANAGIMVGAASVNMAADPENEFNGFYTASSTYGSFSYLKYGAMRLYSQLAQDCELKIGKTIWVAGHSGPETAEDSRTHFGIFSPSATQLFPDGHVVDIHPWEYNEVPVMLAAAMKTDRPIIALHLTRPGVEIPDRAALGLGSYELAAKGAYILRDYKDGAPKQGVIMVQGTMSTYNLIQALPDIDAAGVNVKIVATPSPQLFDLQDEEYQNSVLTVGDMLNSTYVTNRARRSMHDWIFNPLADRYAMSSDWDDQWRPGGGLDEVCLSAGIDTESLAKGVIAFAEDYEIRMKELEHMVESAKG